MTRLELATTRPPDVYANQLRYIPRNFVRYAPRCYDTSPCDYDTLRYDDVNQTLRYDNVSAESGAKVQKIIDN